MSERMQYGGDHYETSDGYEHWDWVIDAEIGYLAGNATKYVSRWRKKNGVADLQKALTYVDKMIATRRNSDWHYRESRWKTRTATERFVQSAGLNEDEASIVWLLAGPCPPEMLRLARERLETLIRDAQRAASSAGVGQGTAAGQQGSAGAQRALRGAPTAPDSRGAGGMAHPFGYQEE